ncbi:MAG: xanthine dehydrogenase molybdopterin binding subunit [Sphingobium sp.]
MADAPTLGTVHVAVPHDSAQGHVSGRALYIDDVAEPADLLHLAFGQSAHAHARILSMDLDAVRAVPGVVAVLTAADIPGDNNIAPVAHDDPMLATSLVVYMKQPLFIVAATSVRAARMAARLAKVEYEVLTPLISIADAREAGATIEASQTMARGDADAALAAAPHRLSGEIVIGGQEHFYLEGQIALATPREGGGVHVLSSTQHPSEIQHLIAHMLHRGHADVSIEVRRMGGAFGGKETQATLFAAAAALVAIKTGRPAKCRADRDDDMAMTGKRHDFDARYDVGFDEDGRIQGIAFDLASRCGCTADVSPAINDRAMFHSDNCYYLPHVRIVSHRYRTHTVSNTAFRGFGGPQGMVVIERVIDAIAGALGRDPLDIRRANLYGDPGRDVTPYHMTVTDNVAPEIIEELTESSDYQSRREAILAFNAGSARIKRGIALTPVKFGISFTTTHLNQGGALVNVYADGSILLNHGGTEMGQGLNTKVAQVVADVFGVGIDAVRITATSTEKVPNTSATAASSGSDINGMAAFNAAETIRQRLAALAAERAGCAAETVLFANGRVIAGESVMDFGELCRLAHMARISLSSTGFYATPKIHYDRVRHEGRPFLYFAYGAAVAEVAVDTLTGEHRVLRADILHDVGRSLNPAIDLGQVEGGFIQGMGWLTTEELVFDAKGRLLTHAPSTYKIPTASDRPPVLNLSLWSPGRNREPTIHRSKAVGEPPLMLAISVFSAINAAVGAAAGKPAHLDAPATPGRVLAALAAARG